MGLGTLHAGLLLLLLCLARGSLQGGVKLQANGALGRLYLPSLIQAPHPGYGPQGLQLGLGAQNGFRVAPGAGIKLGKAGYGVPAGYGAGYFHAALPLGGIAGVGGGYLANGAQPGYRNGAQATYLGHFASLSTDLSAAKYGGAGQLMYRAQQAGPSSLDAGNGNGLGHANGGDLQANGLAAGGYGPLTAGQAPGGYGLSPAAYGSKEAKYGLNGFLGNGYRGRCPPGKC
ncbi:glycine-rich extracellular protein 1 isoform X5 [Pelodiscus sinensis]|uniref:glycine-rich extracellular protein 1 isoform X5 n=1 Tax=Pelodiscus sinensis TaxID=13735 RepID=UPI003F6AD9E1